MPTNFTSAILLNPQAVDDFVTGSNTQFIYSIDVMANDLGGNSKTLFAITAGIEADVQINDPDGQWADLTSQDVVGVFETTEKGALAKILNNKIVYDARGIQGAIASLDQGAVLVDHITYAIRMGNGTLSLATLSITFTGINDVPTAMADTNSGFEDSIVLGSVASNDGDADAHAVLSYGLDAPVAGLTLNTDGTYVFNAANPAYQHLAQGETASVVANYTVTDQFGAHASSTLTITLTGTNDVPQLAGSTITSSVGSAQALGQGQFVVSPNYGVNQGFPAVATLANGDVVVIYARHVGGVYDIFGKTYHSDGTPGTSEFLINQVTGGIQELPSVSASPEGGFVVAWQHSTVFYNGDTVWARTFDSSGNPTSPDVFVGNAGAAVPGGATLMPTVEVLQDGNFVVAWEDYNAITGGVRVQMFDSTGVQLSTQFVVGAPQSGQFRPQIEGLPDGRFVVVWDDYSASGVDSEGYSIKAQFFNADGSEDGSAIQVNTIEVGYQRDNSVAVLDNGTLVVTWTDHTTPVGPGENIKAQILDSNGNKIGPELLVNSTQSGQSWDSDVAAVAGGGFVVTWTDDSQTGGDTSLFAIRGQLFDGTGAKLGNEFVLPQVTGGYQWNSVVTDISGSRFFSVWWTDGNQLAAQVFDVASPVSSNGTVTFADADLTNTHSISVLPQPTEYIGQFFASLTEDSFGDGLGKLDWHFDASLTDLSAISDGQSLVQNYSVQIVDNYGNANTAQVALEISNDAGPGMQFQVQADWLFV